MNPTRSISRRRLLGVALAGSAALIAGCRSSGGTKTAGGPASVVPASPSPAAALPEGWTQALGAAKAEGKVVVNTFPGEGYTEALKSFTKAYPEIKLEQTSLSSANFAPRILQERKAGVYTWDVANIPTTTALQVLAPAGVFDPIRPQMILPSATNAGAWREGFEAGFGLFKDRQIGYSFTLVRAKGLYVNAGQVKDGELKSFKDLLNPKWKGKISVADPRSIGSSFSPLTVARMKMGDEIMRQLFVDQQAVLASSGSQVAQFLVRGSYPIGIGLDGTVLRDFQNQGVGKDVKPLFLPELDYQSGAALWLINRAPHPNAAKVFINWLLTQEAQAAWAKSLVTNSRRLDVEPGDPSAVVPPGLSLTEIDAEDLLPELVKTQDIAKQLIR